MISTLQHFSASSDGVRSSLVLWSLLGFIILSIVIANGFYRRKRTINQEPFDEDVDDLQGSKNLGIKIQGVRQLQVEPGGIRFTPNGSPAQQSLLQNYFSDTINLGNWVLSGGTIVTALSPSVQVQRIGKLVTVQVTSLGAVQFGSTTKSVSTIFTSGEIPLSLRPTSAVSVMVVDNDKRTDPKKICEAILGTDGKIMIQRYDRSSSFAGNKQTLNLASFVFQYLLP